MKKLFVILLALSLLIACAVPVTAAGLSGQCGENVTWRSEGSIVYISGTGPMYDYSAQNPSPFANVLGVNRYFIEEGVTSIGDYAFVSKTLASQQIIVAGSVTEVGHKAFSKHSNVTFLGDAPTFAEDACSGAFGKFQYIADWEESALQRYGGEQVWGKTEVILTAETKIVYRINEQIKPEHFVFRLRDDVTLSNKFSPQTIEIDPYDNGTCGKKTVKVVIFGQEFIHTYFVTDGQSRLDFVEVEPIKSQYYTGLEQKVEPVVKAGDLVLTKGVHYKLSYQNNIDVSTDAQVIVTGTGYWEGFTRTVSFPILKRDISDCHISVGKTGFSGMPATPTVSISYNRKLEEGKDYVVYFQNDVNIGTGSCCVIGIGNYCGYATGNFEIYNEPTEVILNGAYNGKADGELNGEVYYEEALLSPGVFTGYVNSKVVNTWLNHYAYYALYRIEGDEPVLITELETDYGNRKDNAFVYDFSSVYEDAAEEGGAVYMLAYAWVDALAEVYSGMYVMYIPAKVPEATSLVVEQLEGIDDFRRAYLCAYGPDGNVGDAVWTSSDESVATVNGGVVIFRSPGTVTITGKYGDLTDSRELTVTAQDLTQCDILNYDSQTGEAEIYYKDQLLDGRADYVLTVSEDAGTVTVTATGCGLFTGQISRQFDADDAPLSHTHHFDDCEDSTCDACDYQRTAGHLYGEEWIKDKTHHYRACTACGKQIDLEQHILSAEDDTVCTVCGPLHTSGDMNADGSVNEDDAIYLLQHVLLPDYFPVAQTADYTGDNKVNEDDAIYLLQHVLLPDYFPL